MSLRRAALLGFALLSALAAVPAAHAAIVDVQVGGDAGLAFTPKIVTIHVGDTVHWFNAGGFHNVHAEDNSFRCSDSCSNGNNTPSGNSWSFTRTFNTAGTIPYYCEEHGGPGGAGMSGQVIVQAVVPDPQPGSFRFNPGNYTVSESVGTVTVTVSRSGGADGDVAVDYAATAGSATSNQDFRPTSGTLHWGDQDSADKSFQVQILTDAVTEPNETVNLSLSSPGGGATIANGNGTITIVDSPPTPTPPAAPSNLAATGISTSEVQLTWQDHANNETSFRIEGKAPSAAYQQIATAPANATGATLPGLAPATLYSFRVRANNSAGNSAYSNEAQASTFGDTTPCVAGQHTLCLGEGGRFRVEVTWTPPTGTGGPAIAVPIASAPQSGLFYFVDPSNIEMLIKVINACIPALGNHYWVFYAATTNVQFTVTVTDTHTGAVKTYSNALNHAASPVQDTNAFATCP